MLVDRLSKALMPAASDCSRETSTHETRQKSSPGQQGRRKEALAHVSPECNL